MPPEPPTLDGLEQEGRAAFAAQPQVGAERCDEIGGDVGCDGYLEVSVEWTGTQKDLPVEGLVSGTGCCGLISSGSGSRSARNARPRCESQESSWISG